MRQKLRLPTALQGRLWLYRNQGRVHAMHRHDELEFNLVTQGRGHYILENRRYELRRGDLLWLFPGQEHVLVEQSHDFAMWIGVFKPGLVERAAEESAARLLLEANPPGAWCRRLALPRYESLSRLFAEIVEQSAHPGLFNAGLSYVLLRSWREWQEAQMAPTQDVHPAVEKAARLIQACSAKDGVSLAVIARHSGLSAHRLSRLFHEQTGVTLVSFRNRQRIEAFLRLYGSGQRQTMLAAALEAGFGSYPQFHRVFSHCMGISPRQFVQSRGTALQ